MAKRQTLTMDRRACQYVLDRIEDGFLFEELAQGVLAAAIGYTFVPVGGMKDKGIDGLEHTFHATGKETLIYQASIEKTYENKIRKTIQKLAANRIPFDRLCYVTNQECKDQQLVIDKIYDAERKHVQIFDANWFCTQVAVHDGAAKLLKNFVDRHLHEYAKPGKAHVVEDLIEDPRLYVFLRQEWESKKNNTSYELEDILLDTLILYSLEGTDPQKGEFRTEEQIRQSIERHIKWDPSHLTESISTRLAVLYKKPRRINHHLNRSAFCLPYETRIHIENQNLEDEALHKSFVGDLLRKLEHYLKNEKTIVRDCVSLVERVFNRIFHRQGLEFSDFVLNGESQTAVEKRLPDIVNEVVESSSVVPKNKESVKRALIMTIRDVVYAGTEDQKLFLGKMANTYMMLFLLRCDPKLCTYFSSMASKLQVYVDTSILVPALSEYYLEDRNRRHWNLLKGASEAGVTLIVNDTVLEELEAHFKMVINHYHNEYRPVEGLYLDDEANIELVDEIMIRAYFYSRLRKQSASFADFIERFISPALPNLKNQLFTLINHEFGIEYVSDKSLGIRIDEDEYNPIFEALKSRKSHTAKAANDARMILTVLALREKRGETVNTSIFGYTTWWLSKDTVTGRAVHDLFKDRYPISCYIRPDFLHSYISCAPKRPDVESLYAELFPSFLGVSLSSHLPPEVSLTVRRHLADHQDTDPGRMKAKIRALMDELRANPSRQTKTFVQSYLGGATGDIRKV